ncbi:MAG: hypothetical protein H7X70_04055 [Candidatus Kapabacteria bacterium]|nr:hypothetical protein [Candidatus Kapabacteria bacterium]
MTATFVVSAQSFLGPTFTYTISTGIGEDVSSYGSPTRFNVGARYNRVLTNVTELYVGMSYRVENGGFTSAFVKTAAIQSGGRLNVVEPGSGAPVVTSSINSSAVELNLGLGFNVAALDTSGSRILLCVGVLADRILSAEQTDDYSAIPKEDLGTRPTTVSAAYKGQFGFGVMLGANLILPLGSNRMVFDLSYLVRTPTEFDVASPTPGGAKKQDVGWLVGRGIRLGLSYQFSL